jgi:dTMP kinase
MSHLITFEGIEGCGKTTQIRLLAGDLRNRGCEVLVTREPGGCPISDQIRNILLHPGNGDLVPRAELLLYAAARAQHVEQVIKPALQAGRIVLCDRYCDATTVYQGHARGIDLALIARLNELATGGCRPALTLLLDMPHDRGLSRARQRNATDTGPEEGRFEGESLEFHRRVREGYLILARQEPDRIQVVDALGTREEVAKRIRETVNGFLGYREKA